MKQRKEMYKHKDKLKSNVVELDENVVLYKEGKEGKKKIELPKANKKN